MPARLVRLRKSFDHPANLHRNRWEYVFTCIEYVGIYGITWEYMRWYWIIVWDHVRLYGGFMLRYGITCDYIEGYMGFTVEDGILVASCGIYGGVW